MHWMSILPAYKDAAKLAAKREYHRRYYHEHRVEERKAYDLANRERFRERKNALRREHYWRNVKKERLMARERMRRLWAKRRAANGS